MKDAARLSGIVFDHIEGLLTPEQPPIEYEYLPANTASLPCLSMQTLTGTPKEKEYVDGSYVARYRFAIYLRQASEDTTERIDAISELTSIASKIDGSKFDLGDGFDCWSIEQDTLPHAMNSSNGYEDYQVTFVMKYHAEKQRKDLS